MAQLTCQDLSVGYEGEIVLQGLDFAVHAGDYLCIVGENGSGKSTLMKTLLGLQPPLGGRVLMGDGLTANSIGYLPQQTVVQKDFPASVREIVRSGCQARCGRRPFYSRAEKRLAADAMDKMQISALAGRCYRDLSGGQQQRVLLARALCATQTMLLLDEPVSGLDPRVTAEMYRLIAELNQRDKITILMISHDIAAAVRYASHILHIGETVFFGTTQEYLHSPQGRMFATQEGGEDDERDL
ncbi:MAG: ABC transporter ATP-binding protein [Agathobaculum sp.]|uniref:metal ABC transporter ATP-binding protein n=1 Tax=Agathobaculum sp. TaxID=2048138 RepID=UPI0025BF4889|nr:ABC transporter ATP-binding protein [Agathobaculum sp.]MCI7124811.1 ABC transporter ATP-binding protein [Agathobaculum sp.]MDY3711617.1 ABC transporter ATP-binding protein [Agathobaculum sp.]